jgi:hypothetical protein
MVEELISTLFDLRNTCASLILLRGAEPKVVSEKLKSRHKLEQGLKFSFYASVAQG